MSRKIYFPRPLYDDKGPFLAGGSNRRFEIIVTEDDVDVAITAAFQQLITEHNYISGEVMKVSPQNADKFYVGIYVEKVWRDEHGYHIKTHWVLTGSISPKQATFWIASNGATRNPKDHWPKWTKMVVTKKTKGSS